TRLGLYGNLSLSAKQPLTRDNVAVMVFNALTKCVPVQYNELLGVYYNENQGITYSYEFNYLETLGYKNFDLVYKSDMQDIYKRPATTWGTGSYVSDKAATATGVVTRTDDLTEDGGLIANRVRMQEKDQIITVPNAPDYVYTADTKNRDVYKDLGRTVVETYGWSAYVNGAEASVVRPSASSAERWTYTNEGTQTEIYVDDDTQRVDVIEINYYIGQVANVKTDDDGDFITVKEMSNGSPLDDRTFYTTEFAKGDYVIYTADFDEDDDAYVIGEVFAPVTVTANVTRVDQDKDTGATYLRADGEKYTYSHGEDPKNQQQHMVYDLANMNKLAHPALNVDYVLYMDPNGYVVAFEEAGEKTVNYLYVKDSDEEMGDWELKVVLADGSTQKVSMKGSTYKKNTTGTESVVWLDADGNTSAGQHQKIKTNLDGHVFEYSVNSAGLYSLTEPDHLCYGTKDVDQAQVTDVDIHNGRAYIEAGDDVIIVDKETVFVDVDGGKAYTGYDEVPNVEDADIAYAKDGRIAKIVFILDGDIYDENSVYFMLSDLKRETLKSGDHFWEYFNAYVDGDKTPVIVDYDALYIWDAAKNDWVKEGGALDALTLYKAVKSDENGYFTEVHKIATLKDNDFEYVTAVGSGAFWTTEHNAAGVPVYTQSDKVKYDCDDETIFVTVEAQYDRNGKRTGWSIGNGDLNDMFVSMDKRNLPLDEDGKVIGNANVDTCRVYVAEDDNKGYAELVYIFLYDQNYTETENHTDAYSDNYRVRASMSSNGNLGVAYTVTRPEYVDPATDLAFEITVAVDGVDEVVVKDTIPAGSKTLTDRYTDNGFFGDEDVAVSGFKFDYTNTSVYKPTKILIKYYDAATGKVIPDENLVNVGTDTSDAVRATGAGIVLQLKNYASAGQTGTIYNIKEKDPDNKITDATTLTSSKTTLTGKATPTCEDYVKVYVDGLVAAPELYDITVSSVKTVALSEFGVKTENDSKLTLTLGEDKTDKADGSTWSIEATLSGGPTDIWGYEITIDGVDPADPAVILYAGNVSKQKIGTVTLKGDDVTITKDMVHVKPIAAFDFVSGTWTENKVTLNFNYKVDWENKGSEISYNTSGTAGKAQDGKTVTIELTDDDFDASDTINLTALKNTEYATSTLNGTLTLQANGNVTKTA
uniref:hypothetical protein n=1 Tax=uncultured Dysosmobacter sp. TaxID=2591384 RepID=UPI00261F58C7